MPFDEAYHWKPLPEDKWLPDAASKFCQIIDPTTLKRCPKRLFWGSRHHCRECGILICAWHSRYRYKSYRVCDVCHQMLINYDLSAIKIQKAFRKYLDAVLYSHIEVYRLVNKIGVRLHHISELKYDGVYLQAYDPEREPLRAHSAFYLLLKQNLTFRVEVIYSLQCNVNDENFFRSLECDENDENYYKYALSTTELPTIDYQFMKQQITCGRIYKLINVTQSMLKTAIQETIENQYLKTGRLTNKELRGYSCNIFTAGVLKRLTDNKSKQLF